MRGKKQTKYRKKDASRRMELVNESLTRKGNHTKVSAEGTIIQRIRTRKKYETKTKSRVVDGIKQTGVLLERNPHSKREKVYTLPSRNVNLRKEDRKKKEIE